MRKTKAMKQLEQEQGKSIVDILMDLYAKHGNQTAVAAELGIDQSTLSLWLVRLGLEERRILVPVGVLQTA